MTSPQPNHSQQKSRFARPYSTLDLWIEGGTCMINNSEGSIKPIITGLGILNGQIVEIGSKPTKPYKKSLDAKGLHILPGVIDSQVHFRDPGLTHKEDLRSGTRSAVAGGVTSVFEMPNTKPNTDTADRLNEKLQLASHKAHCNYAFFIGATGDNSPELSHLEQMDGCSGVKIFMGSSTGSLLVADDQSLERVLRNGTRRVAVHCEDEYILIDRKPIAVESAHPKFHPVWRNEASALSATKRITAVARKAGRPLHILHVSTAEEMEYLAGQKDVLTVETLPQYLTLSAPECYERLGSLAQMNPPIREKRHQDAIWKAIQNGVVDVLGSDHAPHTKEEKSKTYPNCPSGLTGVQTLLPIMLNHINQGRLSLAHLVKLISENPAKVYGAIGKGEITIGNDADLTIIDLKKTQKIQNSWIESKVGWTPYDGMTVQGWPTHTIVGGHFAMREGEIHRVATAPVRFR